MNLFVNYYRDPKPERQKEIDTCLQKNVEAARFKIHVLRERGVELPEFAGSVVVHDCASRPTFADFFQYIASVTGGGEVNVIANADVYFDESLGLVAEMPGDDFYALTRYTVHPSGVCTFYGKSMSQ